MQQFLEAMAQGAGLVTTSPKEFILNKHRDVGRRVRAMKRPKWSREEKLRRAVEACLAPLKWPSVRPAWLKNPKTGKCMELDLFCRDARVAIEAQGGQHSRFVPWFHQTYANYLAMRERDRLKAALCKKMGVRLIYCPSKRDLPDEALIDWVLSTVTPALTRAGCAGTGSSQTPGCSGVAREAAPRRTASRSGAKPASRR